ncbi:CHAT domain-containing protein [Streptomyces gilvifuscus]|uniref:CHAT domain-containing protein n=1 Tax=Streptomyces gilvifuscus TaxID=1550617 RepID=A0ABT5FWH4_9ACTN|nr:CHAT domain-containing protein [Streptomyces gilvifuscus]MDC2956888.1 CHAT domain-containing protein [Streptomyces gilvifuscus]
MSADRNEPCHINPTGSAADDVPTGAKDPEDLVEELLSTDHGSGEEALRLVLDIAAICVNRLRSAQTSRDIDESLHFLERTLDRFPDGRLYHFVSLGYGIAFLEAFRIRRTPDDLTQALNGLRNAEFGMTSAAHAALTHYLLAHALLTAYEAGAEDEASVEEAIDLLSLAIRHGDSPFTRRVELQRLHAVAQSLRFRSRQRDAEHDFREALSEVNWYRIHQRKASPQWVQLSNTYGWMLLIRFSVEGRQNDLDEAVHVLSEAAASDVSGGNHAVPLGDVVPDMRLNLAEALYYQALRTHQSSVLDSAVHFLQVGLDHCHPLQRPNMLQLLADVSVVQYDARGDRSDLDRALSAGELVLGVLPLTSAVYPETLVWAAQLRSALHMRTAERTHIDRSIALWRDAAMRSHLRRATATATYRALADALMMRLRHNTWAEGRGEGTTADLSTALAAFGEALRLTEESSEERQTLHHVLLCLVDYGVTSGDALVLEETQRLGDACLQEVSRSVLRREMGLWQPPARAVGEAKSHTDTYDMAVADQIAALTAYASGRLSELDLTDSTFLGDLALEDHDWSRALAAATRHRMSATGPAQPHYAYLATLRSQQRRRAGTTTAYALLKQNRLAEAFFTLEELCSSAETLGTTLPWGAKPQLLATAPVEEVQQRLGERQVVHLLATAEGGAALITDADGLRCVLLSDLTLQRVTELSWHIQGATDGVRMSLSGASLLEEACAQLWTLCMQHVARAVDQWRPVVLVPTGLLRQLPLHASFWRNQSASASRHYLLDDYLLSYAPSASSATTAPSPYRSQEEVRVYGSGRQAEVAAPPSLRHRDWWDGTFDQTSISEVLARDTCVVHFTGHGRTNPLSPLDSWIGLDEGRVTVRGMLAGGIRSRLVILAGCDSGSTGGTTPSNPLPLPYALVISGAKGCVATLWHPGDLVVHLLTAFFYEEWQSAHPPDVALRKAQLRLRQTTNEQLIEHLPDLADTAPKSPNSRARWARITPFAGIQHWAAFLYAGT